MGFSDLQFLQKSYPIPTSFHKLIINDNTVVFRIFSPKITQHAYFSGTVYIVSFTYRTFYSFFFRALLFHLLFLPSVFVLRTSRKMRMRVMRMFEF